MKKAGYRFPEKVAVASEDNPAALYEKSWLRFSEKVAVASERQSGSFLEQGSTAVPKFAFHSFCPCGNLVGVSRILVPIRTNAPPQNSHHWRIQLILMASTISVSYTHLLPDVEDLC